MQTSAICALLIICALLNISPHAVTVNIDIVVPSQPVYGDDYTLLCTARTLESKSALTHPLLRYYLEVEWFDINSVPVSSQRSLTVGGLTSNFSRALHFKPVRKGHDRLYVCVATLNIPGDKVNATAQYRIVFGECFATYIIHVCKRL